MFQGNIYMCSAPSLGIGLSPIQPWYEPESHSPLVRVHVYGPQSQPWYEPQSQPWYESLSHSSLVHVHIYEPQSQPWYGPQSQTEVNHPPTVNVDCILLLHGSSKMSIKCEVSFSSFELTSMEAPSSTSASAFSCVQFTDVC